MSVSLHYDSQAAIVVVKNNVYNGKKMNIRIRHGVVKQLLKNRVISLDYVRSERNLADPLTKGLPSKVVIVGIIRLLMIQSYPSLDDEQTSKEVY